MNDFQPLLEEITSRTRLPISLDGIYKWVAFLPSKVDDRVPIANTYFGVFQSGEIKVRGIEARRHDTPEFVFKTQMDILKLLAQAPRAEDLPSLLPEVIAFVRKRLRDLHCGKVDIEELLVRQNLSRKTNEYRVPSPTALAAMQLEATGKSVGAGQSVRFLYVMGKPKVTAWDLSQQNQAINIDKARYTELLVRAVATVLKPLSVDGKTLRDWLFSNAGYCSRPGYQLPGADVHFPLLAFNRNQRIGQGEPTKY